jgi:hypothetical protein
VLSWLVFLLSDNTLGGIRRICQDRRDDDRETHQGH